MVYTITRISRQGSLLNHAFHDPWYEYLSPYLTYLPTEYFILRILPYLTVLTNKYNPSQRGSPHTLAFSIVDSFSCTLLPIASTYPRFGVS